MGLQAFLDSSTGSVVGTTLHTVGAIAMVGALVGYAAWSRQARAGERGVTILQSSAVLAYLAIATNLLGGFMRTYESAHPRLDAFADDLWVQLLIIKHIFLFAGMAAMVFLFEGVAPRVLADLRRGDRPRWGGSRSAVGLAVASVVLASVLGALAQVTPIEAHEPPVPEEPFAGASHHFSGQLTAAPVIGGEAVGGFEVAQRASSFQAVLQWTPPAFELVLELTDPTGTSTSHTGSEGRVQVSVEDPAAGAWTYRVRAEAAFQATWTLDVLVQGAMAVVSDTVTVPPGAFYEINTEMEEGAGFEWRWTADAPIAFDVHSHFGGEVQYYVEKTAREDSGEFTNDRAGGYSLLWGNEGDTPITVTLHVEGDFTLHSIHMP